jgi:hypothetical protein
MKSDFLLKVFLFGSLLFFSFQKKKAFEKSPPASAYSAAVLNKWMALQIRLMATTPHKLNGPFVRGYSYSGLAAYFSVAPGIPPSSAFWFSAGRLSNLPALPEAASSEGFHWPSSLNAALASMNRSMFPAAAAENKKAIDSLETALQSDFASKASAATLQRSTQYGKKVAQSIFAWAENDGFRHASNNFTLPTGKGKWMPTPPEYDKTFTPNWGSLRTMVAGSFEKAGPPVPLPYSEDSSSAFYKQAKEVFTISQNPTQEQKKIMLFWKELNPGITAPGHWLNILRQLIEKENLTLDKAVFAYATTGVALNDAWIGCWKTRYQHSLLRPVTYIREVMGHKDWLSLLPTPPNPEYTAMFAVMAGAVSTALAEVFVDNYTFTDHTYDEAGLGPRTYHSFTAMAREAGVSKIYGGIHYRFSVEAGLQQGRAVAGNVIRLLLQKDKH